MKNLTLKSVRLEFRDWSERLSLPASYGPGINSEQRVNNGEPNEQQEYILHGSITTAYTVNNQPAAHCIPSDGRLIRYFHNDTVGGHPSRCTIVSGAIGNPMNFPFAPRLPEQNVITDATTISDGHKTAVTVFVPVIGSRRLHNARRILRGRAGALRPVRQEGEDDYDCRF